MRSRSSSLQELRLKRHKNPSDCLDLGLVFAKWAPWVTILIYSIAPPHWNLCELWPKNWQDKEKFHIFWPFFMNLTQFYPFFLNFDMILAYFSNITLKIWYWDFCKRIKGNWKDKDFWKKLSPMDRSHLCPVNYS